MLANFSLIQVFILRNHILNSVFYFHSWLIDIISIIHNFMLLIWIIFISFLYQGTGGIVGIPAEFAFRYDISFDEPCGDIILHVNNEMKCFLVPRWKNYHSWDDRPARKKRDRPVTHLHRDLITLTFFLACFTSLDLD